MAAGYRGVIFLTAFSLILLSISLASIDQEISNILIMAVIFSLIIVLLYWKLFNLELSEDQVEKSSPTLSSNSINKNTIQENPIIISSQVPDPLDEEIDIPLM